MIVRLRIFIIISLYCVIFMATAMFLHSTKLKTSECLSKVSKIRIPFIKNQGQIDKKVIYYAQINNGKVSVLKNGSIYYSVYKKNRNNKLEGVVFEEFFQNRNTLKLTGKDQTKSNVSYFKGMNKQKHKKNIPTYERLDYGEVFKGIDVELQAYGNNIEKLFYVKPGASPQNIKMGFKGIEGLMVNNSGELEIKTRYGIVSLTKPVAFQKKGDKKVPVKVSYLVNGNKYGFNVGNYNKNKILVIDPLIASTFLGGSNDDALYEPSILSDKYGNVFISGATYSSDFPTTVGSYSEQFNGGSSDRVITKFDKDLNMLASTYIGGSGDEFGMGMALDVNGDVYIAGYTTSTDLPATSGSYVNSLTGGRDVFIAKLDNDLSTIYALTYLGGSDDEAKMFPRIDMKIGASGSVYLTGLTLSNNFPVTDDAYDRTFNGGNQVGDIFVSKFNNDLSQLLASTYLGGSDEEWRPSIVLNSDEDVYVCAETYSNEYPTTIGAYDRSFEGVGDIFISRLSSDLSTIKSSTLLGGNGGDEEALDIAVDINDNIYITGYTTATNFPTTSSAFDNNSLKGTQDGFITKFDKDLTAILSSTLIGGNDIDYCRGLTIDIKGNVIVTGNTLSKDFPVTINAYDITFNSSVSGNNDLFVAKLNNDLNNLITSTYIGGSSDEAGYRLTGDSSGNIFVSGYTYSSDFPSTENAFDSSFSGSRDCFVLKIDKNFTFKKSDISIDLQVNKKELNGWIIRKKLTELTLTVSNPEELSLLKIFVFRKLEGAEEFKMIKEIDIDKFVNNNFTFINKSPEADSYVYMAEVINASGQIIGRSEFKKN